MHNLVFVRGLEIPIRFAIKIIPHQWFKSKSVAVFGFFRCYTNREAAVSSDSSIIPFERLFDDMAILPLTKGIFAVLGYYSDENILNLKYFQSVVSLITFTLLVGYASSSAVAFVQLLRFGDIENGLYAAMSALSAISAIGSSVSIKYHKKRVQSIIDQLQRIVDHCNWMRTEKSVDERISRFIHLSQIGANESSAIYFERADRICEKWLKLVLLAVVGGFVVSSVAIVLMSVMVDFRRYGFAETENLFVPFQLRYPF